MGRTTPVGGAGHHRALDDHHVIAGLAARAPRRSARPPPATNVRSMRSPSNGVPTAMKVMSVAGTAAARSVVARQRRARSLRSSGSAPPRGSAARPRLMRLDLARIDVDADDVVAPLREAGAGDEPDVAGADDRDVHQASAAVGLWLYQIIERRRPSSRSDPRVDSRARCAPW